MHTNLNTKDTTTVSLDTMQQLVHSVYTTVLYSRKLVKGNCTKDVMHPVQQQMTHKVLHNLYITNKQESWYSTKLIIDRNINVV